METHELPRPTYRSRTVIVSDLAVSRRFYESVLDVLNFPVGVLRGSAIFSPGWLSLVPEKSLISSPPGYG